MSFFETLKAGSDTERQQMFAIPIIQDALRGQASTAQYTAFLGQAYHHVRHTVPLLMACGSRLGPDYEWLREAIAEYIEEEVGHQEWILNDIAACGGDAEAVRRSQPHASTELMVAYAYHQIDRANPVGFFGMVHVLEGTSIALATHAADTLRGALGLPPEAFSYLNSHGSLDIGHVAFFEGLVNRLQRAEDQQAVLHVARMMYKLYGDVFRSLPHGSALFEQAA
ncbi:biliverdin-producing heme oxygenase [Pseudoduganella sp. DS3]|uniref:Biliverdin-producing heme oxygenase n=1 Tax=Pseudoduganella guangdongensis TaxID=2692179 RepID=A0A6N9HHX5_9BURK|nr:iron-containing redox enzyme family protein [Pseudoduganella guangdongensis]MYN03221.1 biliverdin-producing heme oxygenase [Pseudoduganella guangdongensis]